MYETVLPRQGKQHPDIVCGTSVGSINAVKLAEGGKRAFDQLRYIWTEELRKNSDMYLEEEWFSNLDIEVKDLFRNIASSARAVGTLALLAPITWPFLIFQVMELGDELQKAK